MNYQFLPSLTPKEYNALKASISKNGVLVPIELDDNDTVLDGHHRLKACQDLGIADYPKRTRHFESESDKIRHIITLNKDRRHLTPSQLATLAIDILPALEDDAKKRQVAQGERGKEGGRGKTKTLRDLVPEGFSDDHARSDEQAAKILGTNQKYVQYAKKLKEEAPDLFKDVSTGERTMPQAIREHTKETKRKNAAKEGKHVILPESIRILTGDFRDVLSDIEDESVDLIFTDPPYAAENISDYGDLAILGKRVLKPGGSLLCYVGHYAIPDVTAIMGEHLRYWWLLAIKHGGSTARLPGKWVFVEWKPVLWYVKEKLNGREYIADHIQSVPPTKDLHEWEQGIVEANYYIEHLTQPGDTVLDPFCGSGTTIIAAMKLGRIGIGVERDDERANTARAKIGRI